MDDEDVVAYLLSILQRYRDTEVLPTVKKLGRL
jgi:hypothetical protein